MEKSLKRLYFLLLVPAALGLAFLEIARTLEWQLASQWIYLDWFQSALSILPSFTDPVLFTLSALTAVAFPILIRTLFAGAHAKHPRVNAKIFLGFQKGILCFALLTPYLALLASLVKARHFYLSGTIFFSLYAIYYHFPSEKKIAFDRRLFRVEDTL